MTSLGARIWPYSALHSPPGLVALWGGAVLAFWRLPTHLAVELVYKSKLKHTFAVLSLTFPSFLSSPTYHHYWSLLWLCPMGSVWEKSQSFIWG